MSDESVCLSSEEGSGDPSTLVSKTLLQDGEIGELYTVTLSITQKVLLHVSLQVPYGWLAELQLPFSQG